MKPSTLRLIDIWVGRPLCFLLTCLRRITDFFFHENTQSQAIAKPKRILIIKLIEQGASVLAYGAILRAIEMVGKENVYFCCFSENRPILDIINVIPKKQILVIDRRNLWLFFTTTITILWKTRRFKIDTTIDFEFFARASAIIALLTGAKYRVGLHRFTTEGPYRGDTLTHRVQYNPHLHTSEMYRLLVEVLNFTPTEQPMGKVPHSLLTAVTPRFEPSASDQEKLRNQIVTANPRNKENHNSIAILNPNAGDMLPLRKWPAQSFIDLGKKILAEFPDITLILTGTPAELEASNKIANDLGNSRVVNLAGKTSIYDVMTLYTISDVLVTNDSGPAHFASMTSIACIALFGPETPHLFGPQGDNIRVHWAKLACSPCVSVLNHRHSPCSNNLCMQAITVESVFASVVGVLAEKKRGKQQVA